MKRLLWLGFVVWALYLWYGVEHATTVSKPCEAKQLIAPNHRIVEADLTCSPENAALRYIGAYAKGTIAAASPIDEEAIADAPALRLFPGEVVFEWNLPDSLPPTADAGKPLSLRLPTAKEPIAARVIAVVCEWQRDSLCKPILAVREESLPLLAGVDASKITVESRTNETAATPPAAQKPQPASDAPAAGATERPSQTPTGAQVTK